MLIIITSSRGLNFSYYMVPRLVHAGWNFGLGLTRAGLSCPCRTKNRFMAIYVPCLRSRAIIPYRGQFYKGKFQYLRKFMPMSNYGI